MDDFIRRKKPKRKNENLVLFDAKKKVHVFGLYNDKDIGFANDHRKSYIFQV